MKTVTYTTYNNKRDKVECKNDREIISLIRAILRVFPNSDIKISKKKL